MHYRELQEGIFIKRPNRFLAHVNTLGQEEICHVKNTGRLRELLVPGAPVLLEPADHPRRKTKYSLICVKKDGRWVNIDSQVPNQVAEEFFLSGGMLPDVTKVQRERTYGNSRFDLYVETKTESWFYEVKGVTLLSGDTALFPDAPTKRGLKHVEELIRCRQDGYRTGMLFVIQRKGAARFSPFEERQPEFAAALRRARDAGVEIHAVDCLVDRTGITADAFVPVVL